MMVASVLATVDSLSATVGITLIAAEEKRLDGCDTTEAAMEGPIGCTDMRLHKLAAEQEL